jgi:hypothetical protein
MACNSLKPYGISFDFCSLDKGDNMPFKPGQSGNPAGRPKGTKTGRVHALGELDALLSEEAARETLREGFQKTLENHPVWFFHRIIMPLLPKESTLSFENDGVMEWKLLSDTIPIEGLPEHRQD